jgi:ribonucleoside-triphosphate reductase
MKKTRKKDLNKLEEKRVRCEVFSRIVGYLRPVQQWNPGKEAEFYKRKEYVVN